MKIRLKIAQVLPYRVYNDKKTGQESRIYSAVGEVVDGVQSDYARNVKFDVFGDDVWLRMGIAIGQTYDIEFDISSRQWNGRWYVSIIARSATICSVG